MAYFIRKQDGQDVYGTDLDIEKVVCKQDDDGKRTVSMIGSTPSVDRDGDTIRQSGWDLKYFKTNPVILWAHDHSIPAIGRANKYSKTKDALTFEEIEFPPEGKHKFADMIYSLLDGGFIRAGSVGFIPKEFERRKLDDGEPDLYWSPTNFKKQELMEFSICNVGSNRDALVTHLGNKGFDVTGETVLGGKSYKTAKLIDALFTEKKVIPYKKYPLEVEETPWNGPAETKEADVDTLKLIATWYDADNADIKTSYKLPHHQAADKNTVWNGVKAAMGALLAAGGGVDIPDSERKGTYQHLKSHYADFDKEAPEFKKYDDVELKEMFPEIYAMKECIVCSTLVKDCEDNGLHGPNKGIKVYFCNDCSENKDISLIQKPDKHTTKTDLQGFDEFYRNKNSVYGIVFSENICFTEKLEAIKTANGGVIIAPTLTPGGNGTTEAIIPLPDSTKAVKIVTVEGLTKAGAVLSRKNKTKLTSAISLIQEVLTAAEPAVEDGNGNDDGPKSPDNVEELKQAIAQLSEKVGQLQTELKGLHKDKPRNVALDNQPPVDDINLGDIDVPREIDLSDILDEEKKPDELELKDINVEQIAMAIKTVLSDVTGKAIKQEFNRLTGKID